MYIQYEYIISEYIEREADPEGGLHAKQTVSVASALHRLCAKKRLSVSAADVRSVRTRKPDDAADGQVTCTNMQLTAKDEGPGSISRSMSGDQPHQSPSDVTVHAAFVQQRPLYVNLLDDLGSNDFFVIDGDSLLLECLSSPRIDVRHGGQPLHLFYLVEDFLQSLQACLNSRFCFVFYQRHESFWQAQDQPFLLLVRHLLQEHLRSTLQQTVHDFPSWHGPEWKEFTQEV